MGLFDNTIGNISNFGGDVWGGFTDITGLDDLINDLLNDPLEDIQNEFGDITEPTWTYGITGKLEAVSKIGGIPIIYGTRKIAGIKLYKELLSTTGTDSTWGTSYISGEDWYEVFVLCEGGVKGIGSVSGIYVNGDFNSSTALLDSGTGNTAGWRTTKTLANFVITTTATTGTRDNTTDEYGKNFFSTITDLEWTASDVSGEKNKLQNLCGVYVKYSITNNQDNKVRNLPRLHFKVNGVKCRNNSDSYVHTMNPAWILRDYLTDTRYGCGVPDSEIDKPSFNTCAGICDQVNNGEKRHECNIIINSANPVLNNIKQILKTCDGKLTWEAGKYKMHIDDTFSGSVALTLNTDNIIGGINVRGVSKKDKANQVTAEFANEDDNYNMATVSYPDKTAESSIYNQFLTTEDGGTPLKKKVTLNGVTGWDQARYLCKLACYKSRYNMQVNVRVTSEGLDLGVGDVVGLTHTSTGWTNKKFIVNSVNILNDCTVGLALREYEASTYSWSDSTAPSLGNDTELPDAITVIAPTNLSFTESVYSSMGSSGKRIRVNLRWSASTDFYKEAYEISYKKSSDTVWIPSGETITEVGYLNDFEKGKFDFRVRARNSNNVYSSWLTLSNQIVSGITEAPVDVSNFGVSVEAQQAVLSWDQPENIDLTSGGRIQIRKLEGANVNWNQASFLANASGSSSSVSTSLFSTDEGYYVAKWIDSEGNESVNYAKVGVDPNQIQRIRMKIVQEHVAVAQQTATNKGWSGTFSNLELGRQSDSEGYYVQFENLGLWDSFTSLIDTWVFVDSRGGHKTNGDYTTAVMDLGAVYDVNVSTQRVATTQVVAGNDRIDEWHQEPTLEASVDNRPLWDGTTDLATITTRLRATQQDPASGSATWTDYNVFTNAKYKARGFQVKATLNSNASTGDTGGTQFKFLEMKTNFDLSERDELGQKTSSTPAFTYTNPFYQAPTLVITPSNLASGDYFTVTSSSATGATVTFFDSGNNTVTRNYTYLARGF